MQKSISWHLFEVVRNCVWCLYMQKVEIICLNRLLYVQHIWVVLQPGCSVGFLNFQMKNAKYFESTLQMKNHTCVNKIFYISDVYNNSASIDGFCPSRHTKTAVLLVLRSIQSFNSFKSPMSSLELNLYYFAFLWQKQYVSANTSWSKNYCTFNVCWKKT